MNTHRFFNARLTVTLIVATFLTLLTLLFATGSQTHAAPPTQGPDATLRIINDSEQTICYVIICPPGAEDVDDCFAGDEAIPPGEFRAFDIAAGDYDVGLADCDGNTLLIERGLAIAGQHELRDALLQSEITLYR